MKFCNNCESKLVKIEIGEKCPKCDKEELDQIKEDLQKEKRVISKYSNDGDFPFEKNQYYVQKEVRETLGLPLMTGINYNKQGNFLVIFMNAHKPNNRQNNPYHDYYESETGLYHYVGRGKKGDQKLIGVNEILDKSKENKTIIHFFVQNHLVEKHEYMGKVEHKKTISTIQPDDKSRNRRVYGFLLQPIE